MIAAFGHVIVLIVHEELCFTALQFILLLPAFTHLRPDEHWIAKLTLLLSKS